MCLLRIPGLSSLRAVGARKEIGVGREGLNAKSHGHISVRRSLMKEVAFGRQRTGQDSIFVRDVISHIGAHRDKMLFVKVPLSAYIGRFFQDRTGKRFLPAGWNGGASKATNGQAGT